MNAKEFLAQKGVYNLDTKKRYNEVIAWMEEYASKISQMDIKESFRYHTMSARATLYPNKTVEEVIEIIEEIISNWGH